MGFVLLDFLVYQDIVNIIYACVVSHLRCASVGLVFVAGLDCKFVALVVGVHHLNPIIIGFG